MSFSSFLSAADTVLTGNPKKAKLTIESTSQNSSLTSLSPQSALSGAASALTSGVSSLASGAQNVLSSLTGTQTLEVHYNPSSIQLQANAEPTHVSYLLKNVDDGIPRQQTRPPSISMYVDLIFDDTNVKDAFMAEKFKLLSMTESIPGLINSGSALARTITGKNYSVQNQTNGLIALLMRKETRRVTFSWANFSFTGEVNQVQAKYTMFSTSGRPIRSSVTLILQQSLNPQTERDKWNAAFDNGFKDSLAAAGNRSIGQKIGNIGNIAGF